MKTIVPDYYTRFACKMGACRHSCCIGWEIDIDEESLARFRSTDGEIGRKLKENIVEENSGAFFRLCKDERCPFLNADGLCELILELGENSLCQICADHPRFRNFLTGREEIGLGLCCEAAADLILKNPKKTEFIILDDDGYEENSDPYEYELFDMRGELITAMQDRSKPFMQRLIGLKSATEMDFPEIDADWVKLFLSLERLDEAWTEELEQLRQPLPAVADDKKWDTAFEQLAVYLLIRHLPGALDDDDMDGRIAFVVLIVQLLRSLCAQHTAEDASFGIDGMAELARMYSSEIEYSDENIDAILAELHRRYDV